MRILVLAGGTSAERDISIQSGRNVASALSQRGHDVAVIDPAVLDVKLLDASEWDVALPMLHGPGGEDGTLQQQLQEAGFRWVGSSVQASALTADKVRTNSCLRRHGIDVPNAAVVHHSDSADIILAAVQRMGRKVVTKPPRQGSSLGVTIVGDTADESAVLEAVGRALQFDSICMVEPFIDGREVTVAVVDGRALPSIEIVPREWFDYESKYNDDATIYRLEESETSKRHGQLARRACEVCGVTGIARVDMRVDHSGRPWILEINTIPGMTSHSLVPMAARAAGLTVADLLLQAIDHALPEK